MLLILLLWNYIFIGYDVCIVSYKKVIICWLNVNLHNKFTFYSYDMLFLDSELMGFNDVFLI